MLIRHVNGRVKAAFDVFLFGIIVSNVMKAVHF